MRAELLLIKPIIVKWGKVYISSVCVLGGGLIYYDVSAQESSNVYYSAVAAPQVTQNNTSSVKNSTATTTSTGPIKKPAKPKKKNVQAVKTKKNVNNASSPGNTYAKGHCTWYAKKRRPDLPNNLGNANTWYQRARSQGISTGTAPAVGAIAQKGMHVVYVERVNADGTIYISEMNYVGRGKVSHRTVPANGFKYIY